MFRYVKLVSSLIVIGYNSLYVDILKKKKLTFILTSHYLIGINYVLEFETFQYKL